MKYLYSYIVCLFLLFNNSVALAEKIVLPADFEGKTTLSQVERINNYGEKKRHIDFNEAAQILYEIGSYFYDKYTLEDIFKEDFVEEVRAFFPNDTEEELQSKIDVLRFGANIYERIKDKYNGYIKKYLLFK